MSEVHHTGKYELEAEAEERAQAEGAECRYCGRRIVLDGGTWVDPEATGDDSIWRETCDSHDTFEAEHEPTETGGGA